MCRLRGGMEARGSDPRVQGWQLPVLLSLGLVRVGALPWVQHRTVIQIGTSNSLAEY